MTSKRTRRAILFGLIALNSGGCALLGYDLSDYGGASESGSESGSESESEKDAMTEQTSSVDGSDALPDLDAGADARPPGDATVGDAPYFDSGICPGLAHRVFVTSQLFTAAEIGGLAGGDALCQKAAADGGFGTQFVAWLSDNNTDAIARVGPAVGPYVLVDNTTIVACGTGGDAGGLTGGVLLHAINMTQNQTAPQSSPFCGGGVSPGVWTGTTFLGTRTPNQNCVGWTSSSTTVQGAVGRADLTSFWSNACSGMPVCNLLNALYCIEK